MSSRLEGAFLAKQAANMSVDGGKQAQLHVLMARVGQAAEEGDHAALLQLVPEVVAAV